MGGQEDGGAQPPQFGDHLPALPPGGGVETGSGFVEKEELRVSDQADGDLQPAALPTAQLRSAGTGAVCQPHQLEGLHHRARARVIAGVELENLEGGEVGLDRRFLEHHADPVAPGERSVPRILAEHESLASGPVAVPLQDLDRGGLAGAVGAQEGDDLAAVDVEVDAPHRLHRPVRHAQPAHADRGIRIEGRAGSCVAGGRRGGRLHAQRGTPPEVAPDPSIHDDHGEIPAGG